MDFMKIIQKHSPTILTCIGAAGTIATAVLTGRATIKAVRIADGMQYFDPEIGYALEAPKKAIVKAVWKEYIPAIGVGVATIACIFGANTLNKRQQATLVSAYALLDRAYKEYQNKVKEVLGEESAGKVEDTIAREKCKASQIVPKGDNLLFFDPFYGEPFERAMLEVQDAEYRLNQKFAIEGEATLNDFYEFLGLNPIVTGNYIGWTQEASFDNYNYQWIEFEHIPKEGDDGMVYYMIEMPWPPEYGVFVPF